jgi:hypothetical protein
MLTSMHSRNTFRQLNSSRTFLGPEIHVDNDYATFLGRAPVNTVIASPDNARQPQRVWHVPVCAHRLEQLGTAHLLQCWEGRGS